VGGGYGHYGAQNDLRLHFGLGEYCQAEIQITWPDGSGMTEEHQLNSGSYFIQQGGEADAQE